jgi:chromatin remodeling complex protein RSC6
VVTEAVTVAPVVEDATVMEEAPVVETVVAINPIEELFNIVLEKCINSAKQINDMCILLNTLKLNNKNEQKEITKAMKSANKLLSKGKKSGIKRSPQGFTKPTLISDELAAFLNKEPGTEIARIAASKEVHNYIKANKLNQGRNIYPDATLAKILNYTEGESQVLTYLNIQRFLKHHFISNKITTDVPITAEVVV